MKKAVLLKKLDQHIEEIYESLDNISTLLGLDVDDDDLSAMADTFRKHVEDAIEENEECSLSNIIEYINTNY